MADPKATSRKFNQVGSFLARIERAGGDPFEDLMQPVISDAEKLRRLLQYCHAGMPELPAELVMTINGLPEEFEESDSQKRWRELFGADYFGIPEVARTGQRFSRAMVEQRKEVRLIRDGVLLSPEDSLKAAERCQKECRGQFVCVACLPESVCSVHARDSALFIPELQGKDAWMLERSQRKEWSRKKIRDTYMLLRKEPVPESENMNSERQEKIWMPEKHPCERFARPEHIVYGYTLCHKATQGKLRLYSGDVWGCTLIRAARGSLVRVGGFARGLGVGYWRGDACPGAGVASLWASF